MLAATQKADFLDSKQKVKSCWESPHELSAEFRGSSGALGLLVGFGASGGSAPGVPKRTSTKELRASQKSGTQIVKVREGSSGGFCAGWSGGVGEFGPGSVQSRTWAIIGAAGASCFDRARFGGSARIRLLMLAHIRRNRLAELGCSDFDRMGTSELCWPISDILFGRRFSDIVLICPTPSSTPRGPYRELA